MKQLFSQIDRVLRGEFTRADSLQEGRVEIPTATLVKFDLLLGALYGACMALFPALRNRPSGLYQILSSMVKVPLLFLLTLIVTVPSLYVFSALANSKLRFGATIRLLLIAISVNLAVLASLGPVVAFFALCTKSHPFMQMLNVMVFTISGIIGLAVLRRALDNVFEEAPPPVVAGEKPIRRERGDGRTRLIFTIWCFTFGIVGAQMGWILRPFIGAPGLEFQIFRGRESNVLRGILEALHWTLKD